MRHAKSDWANSDLTDYDRPLNKRGRKTAPFMAKILLEKNQIPDVILSSTAERAKQTVQFFTNAIDYKNKIMWDKNFYFGYVNDIIAKIQGLSDDYESVMVVGHNPTLESLIATLSEDIVYPIMPTAAIAYLLSDIETWNKLRTRSAKLEWVLKPKELKNLRSI